MNVLLDTTVLIHLLRGDSAAISKVDEFRSQSTSIYTTVINLYEVLRGIKLLKSEADKQRHLNALNVLISNIHVLFMDLSACDYASSIYADLRRKGIEIDPPDYLIAGIALSNGVGKIVTKNEKHFKKINGLKVLTY